MQHYGWMRGSRLVASLGMVSLLDDGDVRLELLLVDALLQSLLDVAALEHALDAFLVHPLPDVGLQPAEFLEGQHFRVIFLEVTQLGLQLGVPVQLVHENHDFGHHFREFFVLCEGRGTSMMKLRYW